MKTAQEIVDGFPRGGHRVRAQHVLETAHSEGMVMAADEVEKLIVNDEDPLFMVNTVRSWVTATRETAAKEQE